MRLLLGCNCRAPGPATVYKSAPPAAPLPEAQQSRLERIQAQKLLRVCYLPDNLPFAYFNGKATSSGSTSRWHTFWLGTSVCNSPLYPWSVTA